MTLGFVAVFVAIPVGARSSRSLRGISLRIPWSRGVTGRVAPRRRRLRAPSAQRLRFAHTHELCTVSTQPWGVISGPRHIPTGRLRVSPSFRASLSLRTCAPTAPASSRIYGRGSGCAPTCGLGVQGRCRAPSTDRKTETRNSSAARITSFLSAALNLSPHPGRTVFHVPPGTRARGAAPAADLKARRGDKDSGAPRTPRQRNVSSPGMAASDLLATSGA